MKKKHHKAPSTPESDEIRFRRLVDGIAPSVSRSSSDKIAALSQRYGLVPSSAAHARAELDTFLLGRIGAALTGETVRSATIDSGRLRHQLLLRHFADQIPLFPYLGVLDALRAAVAHARIDFPAFSMSVPWREAVKIAHDLHELHFSDHDLLMVRIRNARQSGVAEAICRLRAVGFRVTVRDGFAHIEDAERLRLISKVEELIGELGPLEVTRVVFHVLSRRFDSEQERYHFPRRHGGSYALREPSVPAAFILNLCVKHIGVDTASTPKLASAETLIHLSTDLAAALDAESYYLVDATMNTGPQLVTFLRDVALYDGMFTIPQFRPSDVPRVVEALFDWVDEDKARVLLGGTLRQVSLVARHVLRLADSPHKPRIFHFRELSNRLPGMSPTVLREVLNRFTHEPVTANRDYRLPEDQRSVNFWFKPLLALEEDRYLLMNPSWCAPAFYEAARFAVKSHEPQANSKIGTAFERFLRRALAARGVTFTYGQFKVNGVEGDCDIAVETDDAIFLFELKISALARRSRSGDSLYLLLDLADTLLRAQLQLAKLEVLLYEHDSVELSAGGSKYMMQRRDRQVDRIALTLVDFGALQHRDSLFQIMDTVLSATIASTHGLEARRVEKLKRTAADLLTLQQRLKQLRPVQGLQLYNCWFLSLGQLLMRLDDVTSNQSLRDNLRMNERISLGTLDPYYEYAQFRRWKKEQAVKRLDHE